MLFLGRNFELIRDGEKTYLTASVTAAATTITVRAVDSNSMADNDYLIIGEIGSENAEIMQINGAVSDGTSLTIDNNGSGGTRYAHAIDEPVYRVSYNRVEFSRATTEDGTKSVLTTIEIQPDDLYTRYEDTTNTTGFGFIRFNNQTAATFSSYSDGIPYTGYTMNSLGRMQRMVRRHLNEPDVRFITDEDIAEELNEKQRDVAHERLWPFYEDIFSASTVANQRAYEIDDDVVLGKVHTVVVESEPLAKIDAHRFDILHWDTVRTGDPTHFRVWNNRLELYPLPTSAATTTALNGALTATTTSITVDSTSGFTPSGRIIIDSEVISYTRTSSTQFLGCERGLEETTATTHTDDTTVTERDIIYTANREPNELVDVGDETAIPDPAVIVYGAAMELAIGKLQDQVLHDRLKIKYDQAIDRLRDKFGQKATAFYYRIKDKDEIVTDVGRFRNPNDFPQNISG